MLYLSTFEVNAVNTTEQIDFDVVGSSRFETFTGSDNGIRVVIFEETGIVNPHVPPVWKVDRLDDDLGTVHQLILKGDARRR